MKEELKKYKQDLAAAVAEKERLAEELRLARLDRFQLSKENAKLLFEKERAEGEVKAVSKEEIKAKSEQERLMNIVKGLCSLEPNPLGVKQLVVQNKTLKRRLRDAEHWAKLMSMYYQTLEEQYFELLHSRESGNLKNRLANAEENHKRLKADYYLLKMKLK